MSQMIEGPRKTFLAGEAMGANLRVHVTDATTSPPTVSLADDTDPSIGVTEAYTASGLPIAILLANAQGTRKMVASETITGGNAAYAADDGEIAATGTVVEGKAMESAADDGDIIEVLGTHNSDISTAIAGTTAATFEIDTDLTKPKIGLASQTGGTGDFTTWIKPESTLSADNTIVCPESNGDTLAALALAQTFTARQKFTGNTTNTAGVGITGTAASFAATVTALGTIIKTEILIDLEGLNSGGSADDIIGADGAGVAHLGQITAAVNGTIIGGRLTCLETPATGDDDIDLWYANESTGVEDTLITALTGEIQITDGGDITAGTVRAITPPAADKYLYLVGHTGDADATYSAGVLLIELWGKSA